MAQALRIFGGEIQARRRRPLFVLPLTPTLTSLVLAHAPPATPHQVFHREVQSRRGACAYFVGRELAQLPFHLAAPGDPS